MKRQATHRRVPVRVTLGVAFAMTALVACSTDAGSEGSAPGGGEDLSDIEPIVITHSDNYPETAPYARMTQYFQDSVTERTDGQVTFENYWAGSLLTEPEQLAGVRDGVADIAQVWGGPYPSELPIASWLLALGMDVTGSPLHDFVAGTAALQETVQTWEPLHEEFAAHNLKPLYWTSTVPFMALCTDSLGPGPDGFSGRDTRASGPFQSGAVQAIGGIPASVEFNEIYEGLQRGVLDCALMDPGSIPGFGYVDVAQELLPISVISGLGGFSISLDLWESLPPEVQNILYEEAARASFEFTHIANEDTALVGEYLDSGEVLINDVSDLTPLVDTYQEETLDNLPESAPSTVPDPEGFVESWSERKAYWTEVLVEEGFPLVDSDDPDDLEAFFVDAADIDITPFWERYRDEVVIPTLPH